MAASSQDPSKGQKPTKPASDTVNLTADELRRISGGAKVGVAPPTSTPTTPTPPPTGPAVNPGA
jgi:hypothetical protein